MTRFFLIRHAACVGVGEILWGRMKGVCLNAEGKEQARQLVQRFKDITLEAIYSSPLERARETAGAIARAANLEVNESPAFNEIDFGEWTGKSIDMLTNEKQWRRFNTQRSATRIPGGESFIEVQTRVVFELERLSARHADANVAIVSHADVIKAAVSYFSDKPIDSLQDMIIAPCSVSIIDTNKHGLK